MSTMIFLWLAISIAAILGCILVLKLNPTISLVIGSLIMGIGSGLGASSTLASITSGFGGTLGGIGLSWASASYWVSCFPTPAEQR